MRVLARPRHPGRVGDHIEHPDLNVVGPIAVPEDQHLPVWAQHRRGGRETLGHGLVHQASCPGRVQLCAGEIVRRRVAQVDGGIGNNTANIDQPGCPRRLADWRHRTGWRCGVYRPDGPRGRTRRLGPTAGRHAVTCASPADDDQPHHEQTEPPDQTHPIIVADCCAAGTSTRVCRR